jgi:hypothetical protein
MALFLIRRHFPGASDRDLDAAAARSLSCLAWYPNMRWLRSYWDATSEDTLCIYEADDADDLRLHAARAHIPCDEVTEVAEILPDRFDGSLTEG